METKAIPNSSSQKKRQILRAMQDSDRWVVRMEYVDQRGVRTVRYVSPYKFSGETNFFGLCLSRESVRQFDLQRCENITLMPASEVLMPVQLQVL